jgi:hypothetical protein
MTTLYPGGVDLTFATRLAAGSSSECQITPLDTYIFWWSFDTNIRKSAR